jgi:methylglutaconyl-CoA hydratase
MHNALDAGLVAGLIRAFHEAAACEQARYVVLDGEGPSFCAGADLNWMRESSVATPGENRADASLLASALEAIACCPKPVIARVHGACLGGGVGVVAACDLAVATRDAVFGLSEVRLGLVPATIFPYLARKVPPHQLLYAALTGERFNATFARDLGLIQVAADDPDEVVERWAALLLSGGPQALAQVKELFRLVPGMPWEEARQYTAEVIAKVRAGPEAREGMAAFLQKRKPSWVP